MNECHEHHLAVAFRNIDEFLGEAGHILATADSASPFAQYTQDSSPVQRKVVDDYIGGTGHAMARVMTDLELTRPRPLCGTLWAAQTQVRSSRIAVAEIRSQVIRGYGEPRPTSKASWLNWTRRWSGSCPISRKVWMPICRYA